MLFKHPELLYALLLLVIPFIVHLFRLRRFQREDFTNVKFLKKISRQTRKSSRLKKWLVLITRTFILACIVIAFAQPFIPASREGLQQKEHLFYLDNSYSMQARGQHGELLAANVQALLENLPEDFQFSLITNDDEFLNTTLDEVRGDLQEITYSTVPLDFNAVSLKAEQVFSEDRTTEKESVIISDFQQNFGAPSENGTKEISYQFIPQQPENVENISIDSAYIEERDPENIKLKVAVSGHDQAGNRIAVSLFDAENLLARNSIDFTENQTAETEFTIKNEALRGRIEIDDNGLQYDNSLFFSINETRPIETVIISAEESAFLERIYTNPEFGTSTFAPGQIDYNELISANVVVLNELEAIPTSLSNTLEEMSRENAVIIIIPSADAELADYNNFLQRFDLSGLQELQSRERLITNIAFEDPVFSSVFEEEVQNFEYPVVRNYYRINAVGSPILSFEDRSPFLLKSQQVFLFTAPLNKENSNFTNSPLVVPSFYNMGLSALPFPNLYYVLGENNEIEVPVSTGQDEVLQIAGEEENFIPQQQSFSNKVVINTQELPETAGNFEVRHNEQDVLSISYNYDRAESELNYINPDKLPNGVTASVAEYFDDLRAATQSNALWKWFVIFAVFFLILETILLKYLK